MVEVENEEGEEKLEEKSQEKVVNQDDEEGEDEVEDLSSLSVAELKERCKAAGLPVGGKKADLVARLSQEEE